MIDRMLACYRIWTLLNCGCGRPLNSLSICYVLFGYTVLLGVARVSVHEMLSLCSARISISHASPELCSSHNRMISLRCKAACCFDVVDIFFVFTFITINFVIIRRERVSKNILLRTKFCCCRCACVRVDCMYGM